MAKWTRFDRRHRGDFTLHRMLLALCSVPALKAAGECYEHIPLDKSGEDNQRIQPNRMLIKVPDPTP